MPVRLPVAALVLVVGLAVGVLAVGTGIGRDGPPDAARAPAPHDREALAVLHAWDQRRAAAWAAADAAALARLYTARSSARAADVALLRRYAARGLRVRVMRMQVLRARVLATSPHRIQLEVTDRLASALAVRDDDGTAARWLPRDSATTRDLVLRRVGGQWLMARVSAPISPVVRDR